MNINPNARKILCFGDSNTWGRDPHGEGIRYPVDVRWTGLLQATLGQDYWIIEEGLGGRTTDVDDPKAPERNGKNYLLPCLVTHYPLDVVVLMLGTNDMKERFNRSPQEIASAIKGLVTLIHETAKDKNGQPPQIILMSPPLIDESVPGTQERYHGAEPKSRELGDLYQQVAQDTGCRFIDVSRLVQPSKIDGYHLDPASHGVIANTLADILKT